MIRLSQDPLSLCVERPLKTDLFFAIQKADDGMAATRIQLVACESCNLHDTSCWCNTPLSAHCEIAHHVALNGVLAHHVVLDHHYVEHSCLTLSSIMGSSSMESLNWNFFLNTQLFTA